MILAIDDWPDRYDELARLLENKIEIVRCCCEQCVRKHLPNAKAILLDHDLQYDPCTCGEWSLQETSRWVLPDIKVPTIVTSQSDPDNRRFLTDKLYFSRIPVRQHSVGDPMPELVWIGKLYTWGILS